MWLAVGCEREGEGVEGGEGQGETHTAPPVHEGDWVQPKGNVELLKGLKQGVMIFCNVGNIRFYPYQGDNPERGLLPPKFTLIE